MLHVIAVSLQSVQNHSLSKYTHEYKMWIMIGLGELNHKAFSKCKTLKNPFVFWVASEADRYYVAVITNQVAIIAIWAMLIIYVYIKIYRSKHLKAMSRETSVMTFGVDIFNQNHHSIPRLKLSKWQNKWILLNCQCSIFHFACLPITLGLCNRSLIVSGKIWKLSINPSANVGWNPLFICILFAFVFQSTAPISR